ncbi:MAG: DUF5058 family protein [Acholeplasmataceae bacterium]
MRIAVVFLSAWWLYLLVGVVFLYVLLQSVAFLIKARKKARALGLDDGDIGKTIISSVVFSIAPSLAILIGLVALAKVFGPMLAGMRLGTLGAVTYELPAAINVINGVYGANIGDTLTADMIITALWVMTLGCIPPLLIIPLFFKRMSAKMETIKQKNRAFTPIMMDAIFLGMISAFIGYVVAPVENDQGETYISLLAILVLLSSALMIMVFGVLIRKYRLEGLKNYALPMSMVIAMALAIWFAGMGVR